ncbi:hypothetical protein [Roseateles sp.]|uniref:hypothetical protein n=1 Tax=Roseateles sp. TaxID=1971397 RepID=UPI003265218E
MAEQAAALKHSTPNQAGVTVIGAPAFFMGSMVSAAGGREGSARRRVAAQS